MGQVWHVKEGSPTGLEPGWYAEDQAALDVLLADPTTEHASVPAGAPSPLVHGQRARIATPEQAEVLRWYESRPASGDVTRTQVYIERFASWDSVVLEFKANDEHHGMGCENQNNPPAPVQPRYVFAFYAYENYQGSALVITSEDGRAFDVVGGSHCSCHGLEGQWAPSKHTVVEIEHMAAKSEYGPFHEHGEAILDWVGAVIADRDARAA